MGPEAQKCSKLKDALRHGRYQMRTCRALQDGSWWPKNGLGSSPSENPSMARRHKVLASGPQHLSQPFNKTGTNTQEVKLLTARFLYWPPFPQHHEACSDERSVFSVSTTDMGISEQSSPRGIPALAKIVDWCLYPSHSKYPPLLPSVSPRVEP